MATSGTQGKRAPRKAIAASSTRRQSASANTRAATAAKRSTRTTAKRSTRRANYSTGERFLNVDGIQTLLIGLENVDWRNFSADQWESFTADYGQLMAGFTPLAECLSRMGSILRENVEYGRKLVPATV